jgi:hypothetical protein
MSQFPSRKSRIRWAKSCGDHGLLTLMKGKNPELPVNGLPDGGQKKTAGLSSRRFQAFEL